MQDLRSGFHQIVFDRQTKLVAAVSVDSNGKLHGKNLVFVQQSTERFSALVLNFKNGEVVGVGSQFAFQNQKNLPMDLHTQWL